MADAKTPRTGHSPTDRRTVINEQMAKTKAVPTALRVRAIRTGYYEHIRRREGDVFDLVTRYGIERVTERDPKTKRPRKVERRIVITPDEQFSAEWMEEVTPRTPLSTSTSQDEIRRQHDEILASRNPAPVRGHGELEPEPDYELQEQSPGVKVKTVKTLATPAGKAGTGDLDPLGSKS